MKIFNQKMRQKVFILIQYFTFNYFFQLQKRNRVYVLVFHQINNDNRPIYKGTPIKVFEKLCKFLSTRAIVIHFSELDTINLNSKKPYVIITFDDGHYDIIRNALPILQKYNLKFNVNIDTEILTTQLPQDNIRVYDVLNQTRKTTYSNPKYFDETINIKKDNLTESQFSKIMKTLGREERREFSNHVLKHLGYKDMVFSKVLSKKDVKQLSQLGVEFGSHSHSHSMLINLTEEEIRFELKHSKNILEGLIDKPIQIIAYPNGLSNDKIDDISKRLNYKYLLYTKDIINSSISFKNEKIFRINIYQQSFSESLAYIFEVHRFITSIKRVLTNNY